ncbi:MAG TPA: hypothetical protein VKR82_03560 [Candidatus Acidoferrales bacterium]|nr:hypothetical protein [Candidatus Acidoferrales bacterium]
MKLNEARGLDQIAGQVMVCGAAGLARVMRMRRTAGIWGGMATVLGGRIMKLTRTGGKRTGHGAEGGTKECRDGDGNGQARK